MNTITKSTNELIGKLAKREITRDAFLMLLFQARENRLPTLTEAENRLAIGKTQYYKTKRRLIARA